MKKILVISIVLFAITAGAFAQATATATASAVIISPLAITRTTDMNFGNIVTDADGGTVVLAPAGTRAFTGLASYVIPGTVTAASFNVTGNLNTTYSITLPGPYVISSGGNNMTVNTFTSDPTPTGLLNATGTQTLNVGATLVVGAAQAAGAYTNGTGFIVTINYN